MGQQAQYHQPGSIGCRSWMTLSKDMPDAGIHDCLALGRWCKPFCWICCSCLGLMECNCPMAWIGTPRRVSCTSMTLSTATTTLRLVQCGSTRLMTWASRLIPTPAANTHGEQSCTRLVPGLLTSCPAFQHVSFQPRCMSAKFFTTVVKCYCLPPLPPPPSSNKSMQ